jgi:hypothetical protein
MWLGATSNADALRGPAAAERFVAAYRERQTVRFTPRVVLADDSGGRFACTWDARLADGSVLTGADACTLRGGRIAENWSLTGDHQTALEPGPVLAGPAPPGRTSNGPARPGPTCGTATRSWPRTW